MKKGRKIANRLIVSIFVNPTQFGKNEDFDNYPQNFQKDCHLTEETGADILFAPVKEDLYPKRYRTYVEVEQWSNLLCGHSRPTHFRGVTTIVTKLFNIIQPHIAIFGQKDFQQVAIIRQMVKDLNFDIKIVTMPTVRESDGLAMSSRNTYLSPSERQNANILYLSLKAAQKSIDDGVIESKSIIDLVRQILSSNENAKIDYVEIVDPVTLEPVQSISEYATLAMAVRIGKTRLIDNILLQQNPVRSE